MKTDTQHRLIEMMDKLNLRQADIVQRTGIPKSSLSLYLSGEREPRQDQLSLLADPYGINPTWLMGYDVPMYLKDAKQNQPLDDDGEMLQIMHDREDIRMLCKITSDCTPEDLQLIIQMAQKLRKD